MKRREEEGKKRGTRKGKGGIESFIPFPESSLFCCATNPREGKIEAVGEEKEGAREEINTNSPLLSFFPCCVTHTNSLLSPILFLSLTH